MEEGAGEEGLEVGFFLLSLGVGLTIVWRRMRCDRRFYSIRVRGKGGKRVLSEYRGGRDMH